MSPRSSARERSLLFQPLRGRRLLVAVASLPLLLAGAAYLSTKVSTLLGTRPGDAGAPGYPAARAPAAGRPPAPAQPRLDSVEVEVQRNDTLDQIFRSVGVDLDSLVQVRDFPEVRRALDRLHPGDVIHLTHVNGILQSLNRQISDTLTLSISRAGDGYAVNFIENPLELGVVERRARVSSTLFEAGREADVSAEVIMTMANRIFGWDIDFANDIRAGDEFAVIFERRMQDGEFVSDGRVLAAEFVNRGKRYRAAWFASADGEVEGYFTADGRNVRKAFLRIPVDFTRISSGFNPRRLHPISGRLRAHKGIDYAAPTGTPIYASGDGRIEFAGRKGGYGNAVVIDHGRGITTLYAHMSRFGAAGRTGRRVKQGAVIGYVGTTGASTGPHLHYEYRVRGEHRNPATIVLPKAELPSEYRGEFRALTQSLFARLDSAAPADERLAMR